MSFITIIYLFKIQGHNQFVSYYKYIKQYKMHIETRTISKIIQSEQPSDLSFDQMYEFHNVPRDQQTSSKFISDINASNRRTFRNYNKAIIDQNLSKSIRIDKSASRNKDKVIINRKSKEKFLKADQWINFQQQKIRTHSPLTRLQGQVEVIYSDGNYFKGIYKKGNRYRGKVKFNNGFEFQGQFSKDKFKGYGTLQYPNEKKISGYWFGGKIQGTARINYPTGEVYYGEVNQQLQKHGYGHFFMLQGQKYVGNFRNGWIDGYGCFYINEKLHTQGYWEDGQCINKKSHRKSSGYQAELYAQQYGILMSQMLSINPRACASSNQMSKQHLQTETNSEDNFSFLSIQAHQIQ